jgi:uncharacterized protein (TIGR02246 family)
VIALLATVSLVPAGRGPVRSVRAAQPAAPASAPAGTEPRASEEVVKAIRALEEGFVRDYNKGDSKAIAALFTEDAEVVDIEGNHYQGRDVIERGFAETFAAAPGSKIALDIYSIRTLGPDVAQEQGRSVVSPAEGAPESRLYTVLYVKREGRWLVSSVRDDDDPELPPHERLKDLEWMIGDWVDEGEESLVRVHCAWSEDGNYLLRTFTVQRGGEQVLNVSQRIGWDPLARQIRSWEFDTSGGFGEGRWSREGQRWVIKSTGVRPDGKPASATNIMARERADLVRWASTQRVIGDQAIPDDISYVLVRVPPVPKPQPGARPSSPVSLDRRSSR